MSNCRRFRFGTTVKPDRGVHLPHDWSIQIGRTRRVQRQGATLVVRLSKSDDYLVDNIYAHMLSRMIDGVQEESERAAKLIPKLGNGELEILYQELDHAFFRPDSMCPFRAR
jgi:hypothetical protein